MKLRRLLFSLLSLSFLSSAWAGAPAGDVLWLTDKPPSAAKKTGEKSGEKHTHGAKDGNAGMDAVAQGDEADTTHGETKHLWLRLGDDPMRAPYAEPKVVSAPLGLLDWRGKRSEMAPAPQAGKFHAQVGLTDMGFYNAYLVQRSVRDNTLWVRTAKAELLKGTCCKKDVEAETTKAVIDPQAPLELVREHMPDEALFTRIFSGDKLTFQVLSEGKPVADVPVTMITQMGWRKTAASGPDGRVAFTMIRDYYPPWLEFKKRYKETFLMVAEREVTQAGEHEGAQYAVARYQTTLAGKYMPSPHDYRSYAWGLGLGLGVVVFGGLAVYLYRRRRLKPFKEVRLDEKA